jgi:hypothetical protein
MVSEVAPQIVPAGLVQGPGHSPDQGGIRVQLLGPVPDDSGLAQPVVRLAVNQEDLGSNPRAGAKFQRGGTRKAEYHPFKVTCAGSSPVAPRLA